MKTNKLRIVLFCCISALINLHAQGYLVPNGVVSNFDGLFFPYEIDVLHDPSNPSNGASYTGFQLIPEGNTPPSPYINTFQFSAVADIGVRVFLVNSNEPVNLQAIVSQVFTELTYPNNYVFTNGVPFYLGLYTGNDAPYGATNGIYGDPIFGWAELENVRGTIELLNSALEYQGGGIYAGTQNIIPAPEPGAYGLFAAGGSLLAWLGCRKIRNLRK